MQRGETGSRLDPQFLELKRRKEVRYASPRYPLTRIGELAEYIQYGISERANINGSGVAMIRMNNLQPLGWDLSDLKHIDLDEPALKRYRLEIGDILFNRTNSKELVGKCEVFNEPGDWVFASYLIRVRLDRSKAMPDFVSAFLNTDAGRLQIDQVSRQIAGMSNVNAEELKNLVVPLPRLRDQQRLFDELNRSIAQRDHLYQRAQDELAQNDATVVREAGLPHAPETRRVIGVTKGTLRGTLTPEKYSVLQLESEIGSAAKVADVGQLVQAKVIPARSQKGSIGWIRIDDLENEPTHVRMIREEQASDITSALTPVMPGDLLVARLGPTILNGKIVLAPQSDLPLFASPEFHVLRINRGYDAIFLLWLLKTKLYRKIMYARSGGGTPSRYRLNTSDFLSIPLPIVPIKRQKEISLACEHAVESAHLLKQRAQSEWQSARQRFEDQLLGGVAS